MPDNDHLARLEAWLRADVNRDAVMGVAGGDMACLLSRERRMVADAYHPTLSAAIAAALDRAEEAGL